MYMPLKKMDMVCIASIVAVSLACLLYPHDVIMMSCCVSLSYMYGALLFFPPPPPRYPTILLQFHLNEGTGGAGMYSGGDGVVRETMFRRPLTLSVLTERRVYSPYGLKGKCFLDKSLEALAQVYCTSSSK